MMIRWQDYDGTKDASSVFPDIPKKVPQKIFCEYLNYWYGID